MYPESRRQGARTRLNEFKAAKRSLGRGHTSDREHFAEIQSSRQPLDFFEVHAENYMGDGGPPHAQLKYLRENYALSLHGVGLSIG